MRFGRLLIMPALLLAVFCVNVWGEVPASSAKRDDQPIQIKSNDLATDKTSRTATFTGSVTARQGDVTIFCDRLVVHYGEGEQSVDKVEAFGNVRIVQGNRQGVAGRARYDTHAGTIILEENPRVSQGKDVVTGKVITVYVDEEKSVATGGADRRVEAVIHPRDSGSTGGKRP
jgi:lipopolysaccharide export system protein LptA